LARFSSSGLSDPTALPKGNKKQANSPHPKTVRRILITPTGLSLSPEREYCSQCIIFRSMITISVCANTLPLRAVITRGINQLGCACERPGLPGPVHPAFEHPDGGQYRFQGREKPASTGTLAGKILQRGAGRTLDMAVDRVLNRDHHNGFQFAVSPDYSDQGRCCFHLK
jgi:hypothetical protein